MSTTRGSQSVQKHCSWRMDCKASAGERTAVQLSDFSSSVLFDDVLIQRQSTHFIFRLCPTSHFILNRARSAWNNLTTQLNQIEFVKPNLWDRWIYLTTSYSVQYHRSLLPYSIHTLYSIWHPQSPFSAATTQDKGFTEMHLSPVGRPTQLKWTDFAAKWCQMLLWPSFISLSYTADDAAYHHHQTEGQYLPLIWCKTN